MTCESGTKQWFAVQVKARQERMVFEALKSKAYESFLPLNACERKYGNQLKEVQFPMFPGYLFCRFDPQWRLPILITPGVMCVVGAGRVPVAVDDEEIAALQAVVSAQVSTNPCEFLQIGQKVRVTRGPLAGVVGMLADVKTSPRLIFSVTLLNSSVSVDVDADWLVARHTNLPPGLTGSAEHHQLFN